MSISNIKLNFINESNDKSNSKIVVFQKNVAETFDEIAIAWKVIEDCGRLCNHPFDYPMVFEVSSSDSLGNYTPTLTATAGDSFEVIKDLSGDILCQSGESVSHQEVEIKNNLIKGSITANIFRDGNLLARKNSIVPEQKAVFQFKPEIYIGIVSEITQGEVINSAVIKQVNTKLDLKGIRSADIIMTGGGTGSEATSFKFELVNKVLL